MEISILIIAICFIGLIIHSISYQQKLKEEGVIDNFPIAKYLGGFEDKEGGQSIDLMITNTSVNLNFLKSEDMRKINFSNINNIRILSEQSISNDPKLSSILLFGIAGFAMKDKSVKVQNYLVIDINDNNKEFSILIDVKNKEKIVSLVREKLNNDSAFESV